MKTDLLEEFSSIRLHQKGGKEEVDNTEDGGGGISDLNPAVGTA
jgi:hypothetical protein